MRRLLLIARDGTAPTRPALGPRAQIITQLSELLPGLTFTPDGRGTCTRGEAALAVHLGDDPVTAVEFSIPADQLKAFQYSLERVAARRGWSLFDVDRDEVIFPATQVALPPVSAGNIGTNTSVLGWKLVGSVAIAALGGVWWIVSALGSGGVSDMTARPQQSPMAQEASAAQARAVAEFMMRRVALAPEFRDMRVVHDLMLISAAEQQFQVSIGNGRYVDPAMLADRDKVPAVMGQMALPSEFAAPSRGGYRFLFTGEGEGDTFAIAFKPAYSSFVYLALPETPEAGPYSFALLSETGRIHFARGRTPGPRDPSVTDRPEDRPASLEPQAGEDGGVLSHVRGWLGGGGAGPTVAPPSPGEQTAVDDLRAFARAEMECRAMLGGYGSPGVLSEPSTLPGTPGIRAFLNRSFLDHVRNGYQFSFRPGSPGAASPASPFGEALFTDYSYIAIPVGTTPAGRRSFAVYSDGTIHVRSDATAPQKSDPEL